MRSLTEYIKEALIPEAVIDTAKVYTFNLNDIDGGKEVVTAIDVLGPQKGFYTNKVDNGIIVKFDKSNFDKAESVIELIQTFISSIPEENTEKFAEQLDMLNAQLDSLKTDLEDTLGEEEPKEEEPKEEPKNEEEE